MNLRFALLATSAMAALLIAGPQQAHAITTCERTPGAFADFFSPDPFQDVHPAQMVPGPHVCSGTYNETILYYPAGSFLLTTLSDTRIIPGLPQNNRPETRDPNDAGGIIVNPSAPGDVTISLQPGTVISTGLTGVDAVNSLLVPIPGNISITSAAAINAGINGIRASGDGSNIQISNSGPILASNVGIDTALLSNGAVTITNSSDITARGGIRGTAFTATGFVRIDNTGSINAETFGLQGVSGDQSGDVTINNSARIVVQPGSNPLPRFANPVPAQNFLIFNGQEIPDATVGISAARLNDAPQIGTISIVNSGPVTATGFGIFAYGEDGSSLTIQNSGPVGGGTWGIGAFAAESAAITNSGSITGGQAGLVVGSGPAGGFTGSVLRTVIDGVPQEFLNPLTFQGAGRLAINNLAGGEISATAGPAIIAAATSDLQVNNAGAIRGAVTLSGASVVFNNLAGGLLETEGVSNFGGGVFNNGGTVGLRPGAASATFANLPTFVNAGTITLANGVAGDSLTLGGSYIGAPGARLSLDVSSTAADRLNVQGDAGGTTALTLNPLSPIAPFTVSPVLVGVTGRLDPNAFTLAPMSSALASFQLRVADGEVRLIALPTAFSLSGGAALRAAQTIDYLTSQTVIDRPMQLRDRLQASSLDPRGRLDGEYMGDAPRRAAAAPYVPPASSSRLSVWARAFGDFEDRSGLNRVSFAGVNAVSNASYQQSTGGFLGGADMVVSGLTPSDALILGSFAGYASSRVDLHQSAGQHAFEGGSFGSYLTYLNRGFFADVLLKADVLSLETSGAGLSQDSDVRNYSARAQIGYKFLLPSGVFVEPSLGIDHVQTDFSRRFSALGIPLADGHATRGRIGARFGTDFTSGSLRLEPSLSAFVSTVFDAGQNGLFVGNINGIDLPEDQGKPRVELQASVNILDLGSGWSGFVRGDLRLANDHSAGGGKVGVRYQW